MNTSYKSNIVTKWLGNYLSAVCLAAFLLVGLPFGANANGGNLPILFYSERDGVVVGRLRFFQIYGMNADGSSPTRLGDAVAGGFFARYTPDASKIVFVTTTPFQVPFDMGARQQIFVMNADGTNLINLSNDATHHHNAPAVSPDGSKIAFTRSSLDFSGGDLWIMNADGSNQQLVYSSPGFEWYPSFSPDGQKIAFASDNDGDLEVYVVNADGSNLQQLTDNTVEDYGVDWSPDGTRIAFTRERAFGAGSGSEAGNGDIYVMAADGTNQTRLTRHGNFDFYPIFSPDGTKIVFSRGGGYSLQQRNIDVYVMNANGSDVVRLTYDPGADVASDWGQ